MNNKKLYILGYTKKNLGDDLMFKIIIENTNYSKYIFLEEGEIEYPINKTYEIKFNLLEKIKFIFSRKDVALIGGSVLMDNTSKKLFRKIITLFKLNSLWGGRNYILGSNLGPIIDEKNYLAALKKVSKEVTFWTVRDEFSFKYVKENLGCNVSFLPDIVHNLECVLSKSNPKKVFISVIDYFIQSQNKEIKTKYEIDILEWIDFFQRKGFEISLGSFQDEYDIPIIKRIVGKNEKIKIIKNEKDNIIKEISESEYVIASRFHAMILAINYGKKFIAYSYSNKTKNYLKRFNADEYNIGEEKRIEKFKAYKLNEEDQLIVKNHYLKILE